MFELETFFDPATFTLTYLVYDPSSKDAIVIDPVLDFDPPSGNTSTASVEKVAAFIEAQGLHLLWSLETHAHADHLTASPWLATRFGAKIGIGRRITEVQEVFKQVYDLPAAFPTDGSQFDERLDDGQVLRAGTLSIETIATPGHTPACVTYKVGDALFTGDALFIEDYGTGRCDFPKGSADALYTSIHERLYTLPDASRVFVGHDYQPNGRPLRFETTIGAEKEKNIQLKQSTTREQFVSMRTARDATLQAPRLLWPSVQVNIDAGRLPPEAANGLRYVKIPLNLKRPTNADGTPKAQ
jgi:glyoxylase-like metal-dependent hydrolase (beta-lactamase superfamily II)